MTKTILMFAYFGSKPDRVQVMTNYFKFELVNNISEGEWVQYLVEIGMMKRWCAEHS